MKIIEALKKCKQLRKKANDLMVKVKENSAMLNCETPLYEKPEEQIKEWIQSHHDTVKEIEKLMLAVNKTNLNTLVKIKIGNNDIEKSISAWILRRRELALLERDIWKSQTDRNLKEGQIKESTGNVLEIKVIRYYNPKERDLKVELYDNEPIIIDSTLEVINAQTDLIEN